MSLSSLPAELKLCILENIDDYFTLRNIVHSSPQFHQIYSARRQRLLSQVTIRHLAAKGCKVLSLADVAYYGTENDVGVAIDNPRFAAFFKTVCKQPSQEVVYQTSDSKLGYPLLKIDHSISLLRFVHVLPWKNDETPLVRHMGKAHRLNPGLAAIAQVGKDNRCKDAVVMFVGGYQDGGMEDSLIRLVWRGLNFWAWNETSITTLHCDDLKR